MESIFLLSRDVKKALSIRSNTTLRAHEIAGILPPRVGRGRGRSAWLAEEIEQVVRARAAGATDDQVRATVSEIVARRPRLPEAA